MFLKKPHRIKKEPPTPLSCDVFPLIWVELKLMDVFLFLSHTCMDATDGRRHGDGDGTGGRVCPTADRQRRDEESQRRDGRTGTDSHGWIIAAVAESSLRQCSHRKLPPKI